MRLLLELQFPNPQYFYTSIILLHSCATMAHTMIGTFKLTFPCFKVQFSLYGDYTKYVFRAPFTASFWVHYSLILSNDQFNTKDTLKVDIDRHFFRSLTLLCFYNEANSINWPCSLAGYCWTHLKDKRTLRRKRRDNWYDRIT